MIKIVRAAVAKHGRFVIATMLLIVPAVMITGGCSPRRQADRSDASEEQPLPPLPPEPALNRDAESPRGPGENEDLTDLVNRIDQLPTARPPRSSTNPQLAADPPHVTAPQLRTDPQPGKAAQPGGSANAATFESIDPPVGAVPGHPDAVGTAADFRRRIADADTQTQTIVAADPMRPRTATGSDPDVRFDPFPSDESNQENRRRLIDILRGKRDAASGLATAVDASPADRLAGRRARLEAISGLAALGDRESADLLRFAAARESHSDSVPLAVDAHNVLVALGVQRLVAGDDQAVDDILSHARSVAELFVVDRNGAGDPSPPDRDLPDRQSTDRQLTDRDVIATLSSWGAARSMLQTYGEDRPAGLMRDLILETFADWPDRRVGILASRAAGQGVFRTVDRQLQSLIDGGDVPIDRWTESIESLIDQSPDLQTVQYLAPAALQLESLGHDAHATAVYAVLERRFKDPSTVTGREAAVAIEAAGRRRSKIGHEFRPSPSSLRGPAIDLFDYRGRIVLMPFWAASSPNPPRSSIRCGRSDRRPRTESPLSG